MVQHISGLYHYIILLYNFKHRTWMIKYAKLLNNLNIFCHCHSLDPGLWVTRTRQVVEEKKHNFEISSYGYTSRPYAAWPNPWIVLRIHGCGLWMQFWNVGCGLLIQVVFFFRKPHLTAFFNCSFNIFNCSLQQILVPYCRGSIWIAADRASKHLEISWVFASWILRLLQSSQAKQLAVVILY